MKSIRLAFILLASVCLGGPLSAQFLPKGAIIGNGSLSFYSGKNTVESGSSTFETKITTISFTPWAGYSVVDKVLIGAAVNYTSDKFEIDGSSSNTSSSFTFGPVVRVYPTDNGLFVQGYFGLGKDKDDFGDSPISEWLAALGYSVRLNESVLLDPMVGYTSQKLKDYNLTRTRICIGISLTVILSQP